MILYVKPSLQKLKNQRGNYEKLNVCIIFMKISSKDKQKLKGLAHSIKPSVIIGKEGASKNTINSINNILENKELIKVKFNLFKNEKDSIAKEIEDSCNATIVGQIGNILILFKQNPDIDKRKFII